MCNLYSVEVDVSNNQEMLKIISSAIGTKMISKWSKLACDVALKAVQTVSMEKGGRKEVDIKRYVRIEKVRKSTSMRTYFRNCDLIIQIIEYIPISSITTRGYYLRKYGIHVYDIEYRIFSVGHRLFFLSYYVIP